MVENALSRRSRFSNFLAPILEPKISTFFDNFLKNFDNILENFWEPFWKPFWNQIRPRRTKMSPREPLRLQRAKKLHLQKGGFRVGLSAFFHS